MSSILDALKKLEEEKAQAERDAAPGPIDPGDAADELVGRSLLQERMTLRLSPLVLLAGGSAVALLLVSVTVAITGMIFFRNGPSPQSTAAESNTPAPMHTAAAALPEAVEQPLAPSPEPEETSADAAVATDARASAPPADSQAQPTAPAQRPEPVASTPVKTPAPSPRLEAEPDKPSPPAPAPAEDEAEPAPEPAPTEPIPDASPPRLSVAAQIAPPAVEKTPSDRVDSSNGQGDTAWTFPTPDPEEWKRNAVKPTPPSQEIPKSTREQLLALPILTQTIRGRYGLEDLSVNMITPVSDINPYGSAIINRGKVFVGERIPDTQARLVLVDRIGIGVEIIGPGDRYYVEFGRAGRR